MRDDMESLIETTAYRIYRRYRGYVEAEDVRQEMWVWALEQDKKRKYNLDELRVPVLRHWLSQVGEKYARKEKAIKTGYSPDDEVFYSIATIHELLPVAADDTPIALRGVDDTQSPSKLRSAISAGMEYETAVADVRQALKSLSKDARELVISVYVEGNAATELERASAVRAVRRMQRFLGGQRPRG